MTLTRYITKVMMMDDEKEKEDITSLPEHDIQWTEVERRTNQCCSCHTHSIVLWKVDVTTRV